MKKMNVFAFVLILLSGSFGGVPMDYEKFLFSGRWDFGDSCACASAPAVGLKFKAVAKSVSFELEGYARWRFDVDGKTLAVFQTNNRVVKKLGAAGGTDVHEYRLVKISESNPGKVCIHSVKLDAAGVFAEKPKSSNRRIEFIGDSFTVGFGDEGSNSDPAEMEFEKTNASKSYAFLLAEGFKADFQVNAFSGRGLVRNYGNIVPEWTIEKLYDFAVPGTAQLNDNGKLWDFESFHPQVIVVFVGINDFQGEPPYGDKENFKKSYANLLKRLREIHPGVKFLLVSTKVWPNDDLTPTVKDVYDNEIALGNKDVEFKVVQTDNVGLLGHPDVHAHQELANALRPIIARLAGWLSR